MAFLVLVLLLGIGGVALIAARHGTGRQQQQALSETKAEAQRWYPGPPSPAPASARGTGTVAEEHEIHVQGQSYRAGPRASSQTPYYYPGGWVGGRPVPAGWYSTPWWKTALAAGAGALGGMLILDTLFSIGHHRGPGPFGGGGPDGGFGDLF